MARLIRAGVERVEEHVLRLLTILEEATIQALLPALLVALRRARKVRADVHVRLAAGDADGGRHSGSLALRARGAGASLDRLIAVVGRKALGKPQSVKASRSRSRRGLTFLDVMLVPVEVVFGVESGGKVSGDAVAYR